MGSLVTMSIGELARHVGGSARSLRYYEQQGLLSPPRDHHGNRVYDEVSIIRARNVKQLIDVGLTSKDIAHYVENGCLDRPLDESPRCSGELDTARERLSRLDDRIARLQSLRERLALHHSELTSSVVPDEGGKSADRTG